MEVISLNKKLVKIIAAVLSAIMIVTILPFSAFAKLEGRYKYGDNVEKNGILATMNGHGPIETDAQPKVFLEWYEYSGDKNKGKELNKFTTLTQSGDQKAHFESIKKSDQLEAGKYYYCWFFLTGIDAVQFVDLRYSFDMNKVYPAVKPIRGSVPSPADFKDLIVCGFNDFTKPIGINTETNIDWSDGGTNVEQRTLKVSATSTGDGAWYIGTADDEFVLEDYFYNYDTNQTSALVYNGYPMACYSFYCKESIPASEALTMDVSIPWSQSKACQTSITPSIANVSTIDAYMGQGYDWNASTNDTARNWPVREIWHSENGYIWGKEEGFDVTVKYSDLGTVKLDEQIVPKEGLTVKKTDPFKLSAVANKGAKFVGWSVNGKLVSTEPTLDVTPHQDITFVPVFEVTEATDKFTVTFVDCWNNIISAQEVSNASEIKIPQGITYNGYTFKGWSMTEEEIKQLTSSATITAMIQKSQTGLTLNAGDAGVTFKEVKNGNELICGKLPDGKYLYDTEITVTKPGAASWYINGSKDPVAFGDTFTFFIGSDTTVTYKTETAEDRTTVAGISTGLIEGSSYKVSFLATRHVGAKDTIVSSGFVYGKNMNEADLVLEKVGDKGSNAESGTVKSAYSSNMSTDAQMSLNYGISSATGTACARPFVVIKDSTGVEKVVYGSMMTYEYKK